MLGWWEGGLRLFLFFSGRNTWILFFWFLKLFFTFFEIDRLIFILWSCGWFFIQRGIQVVQDSGGWVVGGLLGAVFFFFVGETLGTFFDFKPFEFQNLLAPSRFYTPEPEPREIEVW